MEPHVASVDPQADPRLGAPRRAWFGLALALTGLAGVAALAIAAEATSLAYAVMGFAVGAVAAGVTVGFDRRSASPKVAIEPTRALSLAGPEDGTWSYDLAQASIIYDARCSIMLGYEPGEIASELGAWGKLVHPDDVGSARSALDEYLEGRSDRYAQRVRLRTAGGSWQWILDTATIVARGEDGKATKAVGIHRAITPPSQSPTAPAATAPAPSPSAVELAGLIARDVNHHFATMLGQAEVLMDPNEAAPIVEATRGGTELCRRLFMYADRTAFHPAAVDLADDVAASQLQIEGSLPGEMRIRFELERDAPNAMADSRLVRRSLMELVFNAVEALDERGTIVISVGAGPADWDAPSVRHGGPDATETGFVYLTVRDDGPGMHEDALCQLFEPGYTTHGVGRGWGLPAVAAVARRHGGAVTVRSRVGEGTQVELALPIAP